MIVIKYHHSGCSSSLWLLEPKLAQLSMMAHLHHHHYPLYQPLQTCCLPYGWEPSNWSSSPLPATHHHHHSHHHHHQLISTINTTITPIITNSCTPTSLASSLHHHHHHQLINSSSVLPLLTTPFKSLGSPCRLRPSFRGRCFLTLSRANEGYRWGWLTATTCRYVMVMMWLLVTYWMIDWHD